MKQGGLKLESQYLGIYSRFTYVLKDLKMGRALVAVKEVGGAGYDPLRKRGFLKEDEPPYITFSKVKCEKDDAILDYANRYGLPFNPNRVFSHIKNDTTAATRAAGKASRTGFHFINLGEIARPYETERKDLFREEWEGLALDFYHKKASGRDRALIYPLDDFWYEVAEMRHVLECLGVAQGTLPASEQAPGAARSANMLTTALNREMAGIKVSTFVGDREYDKLGDHPAIIRQSIPIDFKQALYAALIDDLENRISRCAYYRCESFFASKRKGKTFCSKDCREHSNRMKIYWKNKGGG